MNGIRVDNLDILIKKVNFNFDSLNGNLDLLKQSINEFDNCYSGKDLSFAFTEILRQSENGNINKISESIQSYSNVLSSVKTAYQNQDASIQSSFSRASAE